MTLIAARRVEHERLDRNRCVRRSRSHRAYGRAPAASRALAGLVLAAGLVASGCKEWSEKRAAERRDAEAVHALEDAPVLARPDGPGISSGVYRVVEVRAEAQPSNRRGKSWDDASEPEPDLELIVRADGKEIARCEAINNSRFGRCKLDVEVVVDADTQIEILVFDVDDIVDDRVGSATLVNPSTWGLGMDLPLIPSGRLRAATIVLAPTRSWWDVHRYRLIGLVSGIAVALVIVAAFRSTLLSSPPPPPPTPCCERCGADLPEHIANCSACGHIQRGPVS